MTIKLRLKFNIYCFFPFIRNNTYSRYKNPPIKTIEAFASLMKMYKTMLIQRRIDKVMLYMQRLFFSIDSFKSINATMKIKRLFDIDSVSNILSHRPISIPRPKSKIMAVEKNFKNRCLV